MIFFLFSIPIITLIVTIPAIYYSNSYLWINYLREIYGSEQSDQQVKKQEPTQQNILKKDQLIDYIKGAKAAGFTKDETIQRLVKTGRDRETVESMMEEIEQ